MLSKSFISELELYVLNNIKTEIFEKFSKNVEMHDDFSESCCLKETVEDLLALELSDNYCISAPLEIQNELEQFINSNKKPAFNEMLFSYIDKLGVSDAEIYKRAGIDRRLFSKIRSSSDYKVSKNTAISLGFALKLGQNDFYKLLETAGYSLSGNDTFDLVIQFCVMKNIHNLFDVNEALAYFSLKSLSV